MDAQLMEHLRSKLFNRREVSLARQQRLCAQRRALLERSDAGPHQPAVDPTEVARLEGLACIEAQALDRIAASLDRMDNGTYGVCARCHGAIETERLRAMPDVAFCSGCTR